MIAGELVGPCTLSSMLALLHVFSTSHNTSVSPGTSFKQGTNQRIV